MIDFSLVRKVDKFAIHWNIFWKGVHIVFFYPKLKIWSYTKCEFSHYILIAKNVNLQIVWDFMVKELVILKTTRLRILDVKKLRILDVIFRRNKDV